MFSKVFFVCCLACVDCFVIRGASQETECGVEKSANLLHRNPWAVLLEFYHRDILSTVRCGATLIDQTHLVTAAHCVRRLKYKLIATFGEYDTTTKLDCLDGVCATPVVKGAIDKIFIHPNSLRNEHDIAVLRLTKPVQFNDFIRPICLPTGDIPANSTFYAAGWGEELHTRRNSPTKKLISLPYWENCQAAYSTPVPESVICAGGEKDKDTCRGDSGGPLTLKKDRVQLWGVTSLGSTICGLENRPGIYTKVIDYVDWIKSVIESSV